MLKNKAWAIVDRNDFECFGLPVCFAMDRQALDDAYHAVQARVHPDCFAAINEAQRLQVTQWAARINQAYGRLKDPIERAVYLLHLRGIEVRAEDNTVMASEFLMQQFTWREMLEEAVMKKNHAALDALSSKLQQEISQLSKALNDQLPANPTAQTDQAAVQTLRQAMFIRRILQETQHQLDELD